MKYNNIKVKNINYFNTTFINAKDDHGAVAQSKISHSKRFEKIYEIGDWNNKSILDVGCGLGAYYEFLKKKGKKINYTGFDINELMVKEAKKRYKLDEAYFEVKDIIEEPVTEKFDYVISVGPLNLKFEKLMNMEITEILLKRMYEISIDAFAISMTSSLSRKKNDETFYYNPFEIGEYVSSFTNDFKIDHSFLPHDFVLFVYKKDLYDF